jgi:hypothetical protein
MAPEVKKSKTAFLYFQSDQLSAIRKQLNLSMGEAMTEVRIIVLPQDWSFVDASFLRMEVSQC